MSDDRPTYWFPAKRFGWGWGFPRTWQGWAVIVAYTAIVGVAAVVGQDAVWTPLVIVAATVLLLLLLLLLLLGLKKGEPTRWRWGGDK